LSDEMMKACVIYSQWLLDASKVCDEDKVKTLMFAAWNCSDENGVLY